MATLQELLQDYVNKPYEELLTLAKTSYIQIVARLNQTEGAEVATAAGIVLVTACLGVDGVLSDLEYRFFCDLFGATASRADLNAELMRDRAETQELADGLFDSCDTDLKSAMLEFCLCFLAVDQAITRDEVAFVVRLLQ